MRISDWSSDVCSSDLYRNQAFVGDPSRFGERVEGCRSAPCEDKYLGRHGLFTPERCEAPQAARLPIAFWRRRWTDEPIPIDSRYCATVRRPMSTPLARRTSTSWSSDRVARSTPARISRLLVS